jgi:hypothetical protein
LKHAIEEVAEHAAATLRLQECEADGGPKPIRGFALTSLLDLLL